MISKSFYTPDNLITLYGAGTVGHYPIKPYYEVLEKRPYIVQSGDTVYSLAAKIFGAEGEHNWPIIADINYLRLPDEELQPGETIWLPVIILKDTQERRPNYAKNTSTTIGV